MDNHKDYRAFITAEFIECYEKPENQNGVTWRMIGNGVLPEYVDPDNEKVKALIEKAKGEL